MRGRSRTAAVVAATALLALALAPIPAPRAAAEDAVTADAVEDREWEQAGGDATHASASTVAPILNEPVVAWRHWLPGRLLAEPVSWNGIVYVVASDRTGRTLLAYRIATGELAGSRSLGPGDGPVELAVWQSVAVVGEPQRIRGFPLKAEGFASGWTLRADPPGTGTLRDLGPITLAGGIAYVTASGGRIGVVQVSNGRKLGVVSTGATQATRAVVVAREGGPPSIYLTGSRKRADYAQEQICVEWFAATPSLQSTSANDPAGRWFPIAAVDRPPDETTWTVWIDASRAEGMPAHPGLLVIGPRFSRQGGGTSPSGIVHGSQLRLCEIQFRPAVRNGTFYGFTARGDLVRTNADGQFWDLIDVEHLPKGARRGNATLARNVLYFGNWAADADTQRVLWCMPGIVATSSAIPVADGRLVVATNAGDLVCLADPSAVAADAVQAARAAASGAPEERPRSPEGLEGVILTDGTRIDGTPEAVAGLGLRVAAPGSEPRVVPDEEVSLAIAGGAVVRHAEEYGAFAAWDRFLRAECADAFEDLARKAARERMQTRVRRLVAEARTYGLDDARAQQVDQLVAGFSEAANAADREPRHMKAEEEVRERLAAQCVAASKWLEDRLLPVAATAVLGLADRVSPGRTETVDRALSLVPPEFPWRTSADAGRRWIEWAREILPAGAAFLAPGDPAWRRLKGPPWLTGTVGFRTRNLLLFTRATDPSVVGPCLRNGEGAVRALDVLLAGGRPSPVASDANRLEVRIHANKAAYLAERPPGGGAALWSAGYYSPGENVSRFYVPDESENEAARGRSLFKVLAHELTHHYVERRFAADARGSGSGPGYWVVEGIARFVEDQVVELGRGGLRFDDPTAECLDVTSQLDGMNRLHLPLARFVDWTRADFDRLDSEDETRVQLRHSLGTRIVSSLNSFYTQAGSLCFWMMHRRGPEGRAALLAYLHAHYADKTRTDGWKMLGFSDPAAMEREFRAFLAELRK